MELHSLWYGHPIPSAASAGRNSITSTTRGKKRRAKPVFPLAYVVLCCTHCISAVFFFSCSLLSSTSSFLARRLCGRLRLDLMPTPNKKNVAKLRSVPSRSKKKGEKSSRNMAPLMITEIPMLSTLVHYFHLNGKKLGLKEMFPHPWELPWSCQKTLWFIGEGRAKKNKLWRKKILRDKLLFPIFLPSSLLLRDNSNGKQIFKEAWK